MSASADSVKATEPEDYLDRGARAFREYVASHSNLQPGQYISIVDDDVSTLRVCESIDEGFDHGEDKEMHFLRPFNGYGYQKEYVEEYVEEVVAGRFGTSKARKDYDNNHWLSAYVDGLVSEPNTHFDSLPLSTLCVDARRLCRGIRAGGQPRS